MKRTAYMILALIGTLTLGTRYAYSMPLTDGTKPPVTDTLRFDPAKKIKYGYWTAWGDTTSSAPQQNKKKWKILGLKIPAYTPPKRMERGIVNHLYIPAKTWQAGFTISHYEESNNDYDFLIVEDWKGKAYAFKISPFFCWYFKDNWSVGGRFTYKNTRLNIDKLKISFGDDLNIDLNNLYIKNRMYQGSAFVRNYVGLNNRIGVFNETHLTFSGGLGRLYSGGDEVNTTHQHTYEVQLGVRPGLSAFITNNVLLEASFEVGGIRYRKIDMKINGEEKGSRSTGSINFSLNLLSLNLGIAICI